MKLLSWGSNTHGQLGHGTISEQCTAPLEIGEENIPMELSSVIMISGGGGHTLILDEYGEIYSCGWNNKGQLGISIDTTDRLTFCKLTLPKEYRGAKISCGWDSSMAVTHDGVVLAWGSNSHGQLGLPRQELAFTVTPTEVPLPTKISNISMGLRHTAMLTSDGRVLTCGDGRKAQLGLLDRPGFVQTDKPTEVAGVTDVQSVSCGQFHTVALTRSGQCFVWGNNRHGQLGLDPALEQMALTLTDMSPLNDHSISWRTVITGWTHTCLLAENGKIANWGRNTYGQLGCHDFQRPISWKPKLLESIAGVRQVCSGSEHCIALLENGQMYSWGWNEHGNCGVGSEEDVYIPTPVNMNPMFKTVLIGTGAGHCFAIVDR